MALVGLLSACTTTAPSSTPHKREANPAAATVTSDGLSYDTAIVIHEKDEGTGVKAEYVWIRANLPGFRPAGQSLQFHNGKSYDIIHVESASDEKRDVYFDISEFFGKIKQPNQALEHNEHGCHVNGTKIVHNPLYAIEVNRMAECLKNSLNLVPLSCHVSCLRTPHANCDRG